MSEKKNVQQPTSCLPALPSGITCCLPATRPPSTLSLTYPEEHNNTVTANSVTPLPPAGAGTTRVGAVHVVLPVRQNPCTTQTRARTDPSTSHPRRRCCPQCVAPKSTLSTTESPARKNTSTRGPRYQHAHREGVRNTAGSPCLGPFFCRRVRGPRRLGAGLCFMPALLCSLLVFLAMLKKTVLLCLTTCLCI